MLENTPSQFLSQSNLYGLNQCTTHRFVFAFLFVLFVCHLQGFSQNIELKSKVEKITIRTDSTFVNEVSISFKKSDQPRVYPIFFDTEQEEVSGIQLFEQKRKRLKPLAIKKIHEERAKLDYITSQKIKSVVIPAHKEVQLVYTKKCKELMYFSSLPFFSYNEIDTLKYQVIVPQKFALAHQTIYKDSLSFYAIDSTKTPHGSVWNIKVSPKKVIPEPLQFFGIYKNMKAPLMRTLIVPNSYKDAPAKYMNDWYYKNVLPKRGLNEAVKRKIDALTDTVSDPLMIAHIIYSYVKNNFKYVAIEIGMGAFIPTHANEVFLNKHGDCKDLSNFLSEALKYKGISSDIALAATYDHISDCDFPSLSSANHVICVAYIDGKKVLLDPTDPIHIEETPVQSLQNRTILIVNANGGGFHKVPSFTPQQNEIFYQLTLELDSKNSLITGAFEIDYHGISGNYLRRALKNKPKKELENFGKLHYEEIFGNQSISKFSTSIGQKNLHIKGAIDIHGKTFNDGINTYLFIDYLPRLIETETRKTLLVGTNLKTPFYKKVRVKITLDKPIETFDPIEHHSTGKDISLHVKIKALSNLEIVCSYDFIFNHIFIQDENISKTNEILNTFNNIINEPIILKKKKN